MSVESHFEEHKSYIVSRLDKAQTSVKIAVAWINFKEYESIFKELLDKKISLQIVCSENSSNNRYDLTIQGLIAKGAEIKLLKMPRKNNHMHHKFAIIDDMILINGSFNWSMNASKSIENILIIEEEPTVITNFLKEFDMILKLNSKVISELQYLKKCKVKNCDGERFNMLIFSQNASEYHETWGNILNVCSCCDDYKYLQPISDNQIALLQEEMKSNDDVGVERYFDVYLNNYMDKINIAIHAIGKIRPERVPDPELDETAIIWKNKFVGNRLPDTLPGNFDVVYDN